MDFVQFIPPLLNGCVITAELAIISNLLGAVFAFASGLGKLSRHWYFRSLSNIYVEIFRGTSLLVQLYWLYFALPIIGISLSPMTAGILGLSLNIGAYGAEVVRGAVQSVPKGQREAAVALNFTERQTMRRIIVPQALREMIPPLGNLAIQNLKDTSLVSLITISDLTFRADNLRNLTLQSGPIFTLTLFMYFGMALILMLVMRWLERRYTVGITRRPG